MLIQPPAVTRSSPATCTQGSRLKSPRPPRGWFGKTQNTSRKPIMSGLISKCFHSGGGKHSPHLLITSFFPVISPFFSLLFFHFLQMSFIILLIFSPFYIIHLSLLVLGVGSANCCNFPKLHQLWDVTHDERKIQIFPSWCHLIIQISSQFSDYRANLSFNI